jgi:hypothetical protein
VGATSVPEFLISDDPILTRILSLGVLSHTEQLDWILRVRWLLSRRRAELAVFGSAGNYEAVVREASLRIIDSQLRCLDELEVLVAGAAPAITLIN